VASTSRRKDCHIGPGSCQDVWHTRQRRRQLRLRTGSLLAVEQRRRARHKRARGSAKGEADMSDMSSAEQWTHPEVGDLPPATAAKPTKDQVIAGLRATSEGGADLTQLLTPEGERVPSQIFDPYVADIDFEALRGLYKDMVIVRRA